MSAMDASEEGVNTPAVQSGLYQMAYCSVLARPLNADELSMLVTQAQRNNQLHHISGMLMVDGLLVIQWLEGSKDQVRTLWANILKDSRHACIVELLHRDYQTQRLFPDWSMRQATREEMMAIVHNARELSDSVLPSPWASAISVLCILLDPEYAKSYALAASSSPSLAQAD
jgi:hypothetical protein